MSTAIAVFVKTPSFSPLKTRLAHGIGQEKAEAFYRLSLSAIEETLKAINATPYWAVREQEALTQPLWSAFQTLHTGGGDLGESQDHIYKTLLKKHKTVLLIGADAPQLSTEIIGEAIKVLTAHDFVIGPAHDGGYYLFGGTRALDTRIWTSVPWSTPTTLKELETHLPSTPYSLPSLTDIDTESDLQAIQGEMPQRMSVAQKNMVKWVTSLKDQTNKET